MSSFLRPAFIISAFALAAPAFANQPPDAPLVEAFTNGKVNLNARLRYENAQQTGLRDSNALTLRTRLGFTTAPLNGFRGMIEFENVTAYDPDSYNQGGLNVPGAGSGRVAIADPEVTEVNQAWLSFTSDATTVTAGRQRLVLDNARFVGDVGWRQDQQTFDAAVLTSKAVKNLSLTYAYLWQINRIFAERMDWDSNSHLLNASFTVSPSLTVTGYAYLLEFDQAAANSTETFGLVAHGSTTLAAPVKLSYRAEYARQSDSGNSPLRYETDYRLLELAAAHGKVTGRLGYEQLGSDNNVGFRTPLATLHAFNGWADMFLATPARGLENPYVSFAVAPRKGLNLIATHHWFRSAVGNTRYGREINLLASYAVTPRLTVLAKLAHFDSQSPAFRDTQRVWLETTFAF
jgi:hypothetical protein